ncbi:MAG: ABC transporter substrate-binding protein [Burkholderiales bacterium RIFCSPLOWO2_02_FULL_57_36]|nr:MAG: ABC transporter substrate-binding protein [Burkholderiales bacterium RIFCSPLOWO2_02_FULL_57_36]
MGALLWPAPGWTVGPKPVRIGLSPAFLHDQHGLLEEWRRYLEKKLGRGVTFISRDSYRETIELFRLKKLDFAWICDYPYLHLKKQVRLLAVPVYQGRPYYRSYLLVPSSNRHVTSIKQLKNTVFAYADPYSNTGYLVPRHALLQLGENPATFFRKTFFTHSHRKVVQAVAIQLAEGGAVDSFVWDTLAIVNPELTAKTRIVERSPEYGFPPFVAHSSVPDADFNAFQKILLGMAADAEGAALLRRLNLDGFTPGTEQLYERVKQMMTAFGEE